MGREDQHFTVEVHGAQARACAQYLRKGSRVFVDSEPNWREWTDEHDNKREAVTFKARQVLFEGGRPSSEAGTDQVAAAEQTPAATPAQTSDTAPVPAASASGNGAEATADDLPF